MNDSGEDFWSLLPEPVAPPQANGELLFEAPWQGRTFGMVHALVDAGHFSWDDFRDQLIIALDGGAAGAEVYYERLLLALERTLAQQTSTTALHADEIAARTTELEQRPHGHDH